MSKIVFDRKLYVICFLLLCIIILLALVVTKSPIVEDTDKHSITAHISAFQNKQAHAEKYVPKIAYLFAGSARSFVCPKVHWSIRSHLIDSFGGEPYVFVRVSNEDNLNIKTGLGTVWTPTYGKNELNETLRILNPRRVDYFSFADQIEEMKRNYPGPAHTVFRENDQRRYSMFYHRCMSYRMARDYEEANGVRFDWVVLVRLDAAWLEPILPIQSYAKDRVWLTETGYDLFNDQFMLIPRQFSDYLYDLDTKVAKGVYCLGGPDVEKWKCDASLSEQHGVSRERAREVVQHCCSDLDGENWLGGSEQIHLRHLRAGRIPVSIARFPVFLTRIRSDSSCHAECDRLQMNSVGEHANRVNKSYEFFAPYRWPDTRGAAINFNDATKCSLIKHDAFSWKPLSAAQLHESNLHVAAAVDYSKSLYDQRGALHPSVLLNPRDLEAWRVHPTWNVEGCLTFSFSKKALFWDECRDHNKLKGGFAYDARQSFYLQVVPHPMSLEQTLFDGRFGGLRHSGSKYLNDDGAASNFTRVMLPDRDAVHWDENGKIMCMTIVGEAKLRAAVGMADCLAEKLHPSQLFRTVTGLTRGTHHETTVGRLHVASAPRLCVTRSDNREMAVSMYVSGERLELGECFKEDAQQWTLFEFELVA